ncbi:AGAP008442-PA-like protein [Anopheles sinensis]|uniref:AGAP008442-PA-like protein n=1 Tax=Anopheles sinensis TaxID=74873 RepID=A0A084W1X6_ANOSI|nr:AGAP008442-PA-like protein [Anopheles sinensis]
MSRPLVQATYLLLLLVVLCISGPDPVYSYENSHVAHHPLDALFRPQPSAEKHSGPVTGVVTAGGSVGASQVSHGSLAAEQHHPSAVLQHESQQKPPVPSPFQAFAPFVAQHRGVMRRRAVVEPGGVGNRHRWHADQRPAVFGSDVVPAFRALPALDIGRPGSDEDFADQSYPGGLEHPVALDPAENEIGDSPLSAVALGPLGRPRMDSDGAGEGRMMESIDLIREQLERIKQEEDIEIKSNLLMKLLTELPEGPLPIVYIEDAAGLAGAVGKVDDAADADTDEDNDDGDDGDDEEENEGRLVTGQFTPNGGKRSGRYYRRYPWKRQNSRSRTYDAEARYLCVPSREDVFKLLVGLHENRVGNHQRTVNFCNRKRPAKAIFTNIRFLG